MFGIILFPVDIIAFQISDIFQQRTPVAANSETGRDTSRGIETCGLVPRRSRSSVHLFTFQLPTDVCMEQRQSTPRVKAVKSSDTFSPVPFHPDHVPGSGLAWWWLQNTLADSKHR